MRGKHYVLAAGGTGGHMVPAAALATELTRRGHRVALVSDARGVRFPGLFEGIQTHVLPAGRFEVKRPIGWLPAAREMWRGRVMARELYRTFRPAAVIGFGGYPALPALWAAFADNIPTAVHEQNAVLGRVNRLVASRVDAIATSYDRTERLPAKLGAKVHAVGNPVREAVLALRAKPFPLLEEDGIFRVLVTGGSQGASILSRVVPDGLAMLPVTFRRRLQVTHQARIEDIDAVRAKYAQHSIPADTATYLPDMPEQLAWAHLVIARAGASTIAELTVAGRPAILVPLPSATDDHQTANAREIVAAGGATVLTESRIVAEVLQGAGDAANRKRLAQSEALERMRDQLVKQIQKIAMEPGSLENAAGRAKSVGRPNAVSDFADLVESLDAPVSRLPVVARGPAKAAWA